MTHPWPRNRVHESPRPKSGVVTIVVGAESVILDGWLKASVLSPSATQIWSRFDGHTTLEAIIDDLSAEFQADRETVELDVAQLAQHLASLGVLDGVETDYNQDQPPVSLRAARIAAEVGDRIEGLSLSDIWGSSETTLLPVDAPASLLVNWSPHCGYCASILNALAGLDAQLERAGVPLVLFAHGSAEASQTQADLSGWHPRLLLKPQDEVGPFAGYGTPAAFHLAPDGALVSAVARGTDEVLQLASDLAGVDLNAGPASNSPSDARSLLDPGGSCAPGTGSEPVTRWTGTQVYRIGDYPVGIRYTADSAAALLDELFHHQVVEDPQAGHIYTLDLPGLFHLQEGAPPKAEANLLLLGSQVLVRSRSPERVLRALLWRLDSQIQRFE